MSPVLGRFVDDLGSMGLVLRAYGERDNRQVEDEKGEKAMNPTHKRGKRNVFCSFYSECLDIAIGKGWMHWTCAKCDQRFNKEAEPEIPLNVNYHVAYYEVTE